jgi:hypothetical protein
MEVMITVLVDVLDMLVKKLVLIMLSSYIGEW